VIPSLPYTDSGTTVGAGNDYDEICPYMGSLSPDVVYSYTPATAQIVDITLCTGTTNYDTKLYVYENSCPAPGTGATGSEIACSDDECSAPLYLSNYVSSLTDLHLVAFHTYYIVVDGYASSQGNYTIDVTRRLQPPLPAVMMMLLH